MFVRSDPNEPELPPRVHPSAWFLQRVARLGGVLEVWGWSSASDGRTGEHREVRNRKQESRISHGGPLYSSRNASTTSIRVARRAGR